MSFTKGQLERSHIVLLDNGQIALADKTKSGALRIFRVITRQEIASIISIFFMQYAHQTGNKVLQLPHGTDKVLAMTLLDLPKEAPLPASPEGEENKD